MEFLTVNIEHDNKENININLFSGNMTISVSVEGINAILEDFSDSWKTKTNLFTRFNENIKYKVKH